MKLRDVGQDSFQLSTFHLTNYGSVLYSGTHFCEERYIRKNLVHMKE